MLLERDSKLRERSYKHIGDNNTIFVKTNLNWITRYIVTCAQRGLHRVVQRIRSGTSNTEYRISITRYQFRENKRNIQRAKVSTPHDSCIALVDKFL